ncbi:hypothetical protein FACS189467_7620 [Bacteroidia bacterium]|nr:hypothetical protein FACS189467_7620 [Bacteroidia bacterium]
MKSVKVECKNIMLVAMLFAAVSYTAVGQEYKKDMRPRVEKEDIHGMQVDRITALNLLKALEIAGIRIFVFPLKPFDKKYYLSFYLNEYVDGEKINTNDFFGLQISNDYTHTGGEKSTAGDKDKYYDYFDNITFYTKNVDSVATVSFDMYGRGMGGIKLHKNITREDQFYKWRSYSQTDWRIGEEIPLLVYASSWWDKEDKIDRFCGVVDLSKDEKGTQELLESSLHYFVFTYKVYE